MTKKKEVQVIENEEAKTIESALIEIVQRKDIDPERLEKFLDLQIKMEDRQSQKELFSALALFQGECPIIKKTKKVEFKSVKYSYSPLDEIIHIIKPIMLKHGLSFTFNVVTEADQNKLVTAIRHKGGAVVEYDYYYESIHDDQRMNDAQRRKSALTFAKRAALENALGIATADEDDDARRSTEVSITDDQVKEIDSLLAPADTSKEKFLSYLSKNYNSAKN